jgi:lactate dehydrogenase-like 2-hydroxyacid dehydrogenase
MCSSEGADPSRIARRDNAVLLPHLGSVTVKTRLAMADLVADNLLEALEDQQLPTLLNPWAAGHQEAGRWS